MATIKSKNLTVINDKEVKPTEVKYIIFDEDDKNEKIGVSKTLNGYNFSLTEILLSIGYQMDGELQGAKIIAGLEPNTQLCSKELDLNEDTIYDSTIGVENPVITITEKDINRAKNTVKQYEYIIGVLNLLLYGSTKVEKPKYDLLP